MSSSLLPGISSMEVDAPVANDGAVDALNEQVPVVDTPVNEVAGESGVSADEEVRKTENDPQEEGDHPLKNDAPTPLEGQQLEQTETHPTEANAMDAEGDDKQQPNFSMAEVESDGSAASDPATAQSADAPESVQEGDTANVQDDTETENDSDEKDEALDVSAVETSATTEGVIVPDCQDNLATETVSESTPADHGDNPSTVEVNDTLSEEHGVENDCPMENTEGGASAPTHDESEYDPAAPVLLTAVVPHGEDEYDPANPSPAETPVGSNATTGFANHREQEEYDPDHPSMIPSAVTEEPATMEEDQISPSITSSGQPVVTPGKRKADEMPNDSSVSTANGDSGSKRPRHVDENKSKSADEDHKHKRHRRGSGDSTTSSSSKLKEQDHKGLSDAAWDRLMDFQTSGEFRVTQVSRAAFASVGAMPEFAQIAIIARFVRTPMRDIRDKNGQLMRIYREYQKENPQVSALQSVDVFMSDYKNEPGLFRFGYAPPLPATGMSSVHVPYQRDPPKEEKTSPRPTRAAAARNDPERHQQKDVDEFGRSVHSDKSTAPATNGSGRSGSQRAATDPRLAARGRQGPPSPITQPNPRSATGTRVEDPRRRDQPHPQSSSGAGRDPRRRGSATNQHPSPRTEQPGVPRVAGSNELFERLPGPVKAVVDSMRRERRLQEPLNDNVVTRLLHLPERVALQAVENFSNVDLSQVENLQGFLVGIINRVNEKAIASEKQQRPQVPSPRGQSPSTMPRGGGYAGPPQGGSVLGGPPQGGRLNPNNGPNSGGYRSQPAPMAAPGPALYERPYEAPQDPRDPRRRQPAGQTPSQYGGAVRGPSPAHAPAGMQSFTALPVSVQNHVHSLVANHTLSSLEELGGKCYEVLGQLSEPLANQVLTRFAGANLSNVRNKSGFLIGVVKRARQEYGFN